MKMWYEGKTHIWYGLDRKTGKHFESSSFRDVWLWCMGYGCDNAAELRYEMASVHTAEKAVVNR
jgi:hypothetical protein